MPKGTFGELVEYETEGGIFSIPPETHDLTQTNVLASVAEDYAKVAGLGRTLQLDVETFTQAVATVFHADVIAEDVSEDAAETFASLAWVQSWPEWELIPVGQNIPAHTEQSPSYVRHDLRLWQVKQSHNKLNTWTPLVAVSLFWPWYDPSEPVAWKAVTGSHDTYPLNYRVTHLGKTWRSAHAFNSWEPGAVGSELLWIDENPPAVGVWTAGVLYTINTEVTHLGILYRCRQTHTAQIGWEPPNVLALWLPI